VEKADIWAESLNHRYRDNPSAYSDVVLVDRNLCKTSHFLIMTQIIQSNYGEQHDPKEYLVVNSSVI